MAGLETTDENWLRDEVKRRGGYCLKLGFITGIPDRLILLPGARVGFVELKKQKTKWAKAGKPSPLQVKWVSKLTAIGFKAECIDNKDRLIKFLNGL